MSSLFVHYRIPFQYAIPVPLPTPKTLSPLSFAYSNAAFLSIEFRVLHEQYIDFAANAKGQAGS